MDLTIKSIFRIVILLAITQKIFTANPWYSIHPNPKCYTPSNWWMLAYEGVDGYGYTFYMFVENKSKCMAFTSSHATAKWYAFDSWMECEIECSSDVDISLGR
ncbi:uncharacterized protein LOC106649607 [Trichogramma pretiosum]|uniref:Uncharacterized protein n=1 Tax=Trichogramma kaykai TaxID=54128 RepID=A0ABD2W308_9HYME|nr:uncharacterized protein LOC106649607 [Trichogramma pretiosum]XP_014222564.1 uncharacterized protein LOC106649607 [Trichogramma pretiosum]XP_023314716.1 uncharacterized protein LOC106649607 [Trichogramma pretiosum]XP_023314717.1 uncharacterized protein LOC106649607 [Trichogramma pretiosum]